MLTVQACYVAAELYGHDCGGLTHGGEIEALAVLAYRPDLVHLDRIDYSSDHSHGRKMGQAAPHPQLPAGAERHQDDRADRLVRQPEHATVDKGHRMLNDIADAIAKEAREIFRSSTRRRAAPPRSSSCGRPADGAAAQAIGSEAAGAARPQLA